LKELKGAFQLAVIDMILVFIIFKRISLGYGIVKKGCKHQKPVKLPKETKIISPAVISVPKIQGEEIESKLIAVITAAITSCLATPRSEFKIVNIKNINHSLTLPGMQQGDRK